ncbi:hypothetical protein JT359_11695 [Candidatus Poribacteria bacterium]|nr:hypothetical protein [Candidatus Poribacteria bacterium]
MFYDSFIDLDSLECLTTFIPGEHHKVFLPLIPESGWNVLRGEEELNSEFTIHLGNGIGSIEFN